jgi:hypothetical protein
LFNTCNTGALILLGKNYKQSCFLKYFVWYLELEQEQVPVVIFSSEWKKPSQNVVIFCRPNPLKIKATYSETMCI